VGGNTGVYEGTIVRKRAVIGGGTVLTVGRRFTILSRVRCIRHAESRW